MKANSKEILIKGTPICRGIAIGKSYFISLIDDKIPDFTVDDNDINEEIARFHEAVNRSKEDIQRLQKKLESERVFEGAAILEAHLHIMQDPLLTTRIESEIREVKKNAESVFRKLIEEYQIKFQSLEDPFFRERFRDIQDISNRVMGYLCEKSRISLSDIPTSSVVFSREITASEAAEAHEGRVSAFITESGGMTSHAAIVARAKGIPYVTSINLKNLKAQNQAQTVIVDGRTGEIIINPSLKTLSKYEKEKDRLKSHLLNLVKSNKLKAETFDGYAVKLSANIDSFYELDMLHQSHGTGVGLFRSEYMFLNSPCFPSENEQFNIYKKIVEKMKGKPIVIRTFDIGGDKFLLKHGLPHEENPFLGCRAIRFLLKEKELFKNQLRAIVRSSAYGVVRILFPMIASLNELIESKKLLEEVYVELKKKRIPHDKNILVGCMIEVPSAALIVDFLAKECDFLSIGTNDLVQYALAVDRSNHALSNLYTPTDPSVIRLIRLVVQMANLHKIPVSVCGEVAADPRFTPLLLGLGVHELSVAARYLPTIKNAIRNTSIVSANQLADKVLKLKTAQEIQNLLTKEYQKSIPDDGFYNH